MRYEWDMKKRDMSGDFEKEVSDLVLIGVSSVDEECVWPPYLV